jgi:hypothetical protein
MDKLPCDLINKILKNVTIDNAPLLTYRLKFVNKPFKNFIENENYELCKYILDTQNVKNKLYSNGMISIFEWLYNHNIYIKYVDIFELINYNRIDVMYLSMMYKNNINIIFNRFFLSNMNETFNLFNLGYQGKSYFLHACEKNKLDICKFLLEYKKNELEYYTCYHSQVEQGINMSLKYNNSDIYKYLIKFHYDKY